MLAVDPGINGCGVANFFGGTLVAAYYVPAPKHPSRSRSMRCMEMACQVLNSVNTLTDNNSSVVEWPQIYRAGRSKGDPNDLLLVAGVAAALGFEKTVLPAEWKGQLPKSVVERRVRQALSEDELGSVRLPAKSLQHNVWDAIGIGLFALGLFNPRRAHGTR